MINHYLSIVFFLITFGLVTSCDYDGRSCIPVKNNTDSTIGVAWTFYSVSSEGAAPLYRMPKQIYGDSYYVEPHDINEDVITVRRPSCFEDYFLYTHDWTDTLSIYIVKKKDLERMIGNKLDSVTYDIYQYTLHDIVREDWTVNYPDIIGPSRTLTFKFHF